MSETILALRVKDFCLRIGISASTFWKYNKHGKIRVIRVGGRVLIPHGEALRIATEGLTEIQRLRSRENESVGAGDETALSVDFGSVRSYLETLPTAQLGENRNPLAVKNTPTNCGEKPSTHLDRPMIRNPVDRRTLP